MQCAGVITPTRSVSWNAPDPLVRAMTTMESPMRTAKCPLSRSPATSPLNIGVAMLTISTSSSEAGGEARTVAARPGSA